MRLILLFIFSVLVFPAVAQENTMILKDQKAIQREIDQIADMTPDVYYAQIDSLRESVEKFLSTKKKVCKGEYAPYILAGQGDGVLPSKTKVDEKEKKQCNKELKKLHINYLESMFSARKRFLEANLKQRVNELRSHYEKSLKDLDGLYSN